MLYHITSFTHLITAIRVYILVILNARDFLMQKICNQAKKTWMTRHSSTYKDHFLASGNATETIDKQYGQDPDHAKKNTNPTAYHEQGVISARCWITTEKIKTAPRINTTMQPSQVWATSNHWHGARMGPYNDYPGGSCACYSDASQCHPEIAAWVSWDKILDHPTDSMIV